MRGARCDHDHCVAFGASVTLSKASASSSALRRLESVSPASLPGRCEGSRPLHGTSRIQPCEDDGPRQQQHHEEPRACCDPYHSLHGLLLTGLVDDYAPLGRARIPRLPASHRPEVHAASRMPGHRSRGTTGTCAGFRSTVRTLGGQFAPRRLARSSLRRHPHESRSPKRAVRSRLPSRRQARRGR